MSINILVTEDESIVRKDIEQTLEKIGYNVVATADNGEDAIDLAVRYRPDVVLMDIMLKGDMNGIAAAEAAWENMFRTILLCQSHGRRKSDPNHKRCVKLVRHSTPQVAPSGGGVGVPEGFRREPCWT